MNADDRVTWWVLYRFEHLENHFEGCPVDTLACGCADLESLWAPSISLLLADLSEKDGEACVYCFERRLATCPGMKMHVAMQRDKAEVAAGFPLHLAAVELPVVLGWREAFAAIKHLIAAGLAMSVEQNER